MPMILFETQPTKRARQAVTLDSKSIIQMTVAQDAEAERELLSVLRELIDLSVERPGGVTVDELAHRVGRDHDRRSVRELLERGRGAVEDEVGSPGRFAVVERVYDDPFAYWRARYVPTSFGRVWLQGLDAGKGSR
jgi:hypothetical protein